MRRSSAANPFDLKARRVSTSRERPKKAAPLPLAARLAAPRIDQVVIRSNKYSATEIREMLKGYDRLSPADWPSLKPGQQIRYVRVEGNTFVIGGFITGRPMRDESPALAMANALDPSAPGYTTWVVQLKAIQTIFRKR